MIWRKKPLKSKFVYPSLAMPLFFAIAACGVKGDPVPPEKPPELGRGRPTYKRAIEDIKIEKNGARDAVPGRPIKKDQDDEEE